MTSLPALNLLPPDRKRALQHQQIVSATLSSALLIGLSIAVSAGLLITNRVILREHLSQLQDEARRSEQAIIKQQGSLPQDRIRQFNALLTRVVALHKSSIDWSSYLDDLETYLPPGIKLTSIELGNAKQLSLAGIAATRDDLQKIKSSLSASPLFRNFSTPVANLLDRANVSFTLTAEVILP